jgi:hypothetical protein
MIWRLRIEAVVLSEHATGAAELAIDISKRSVANANRIFQHGLKYRLQLAGR